MQMHFLNCKIVNFVSNIRKVEKYCFPTAFCIRTRITFVTKASWASKECLENVVGIKVWWRHKTKTKNKQPEKYIFLSRQYFLTTTTTLNNINIEQ